MTTAPHWQAGSNPCPPTHPSERAFEAFLTAAGYSFDKERHRFDISCDDQPDRAVQPDYYITRTPDGLKHTHLFIEITEADRHKSVLSLSRKVRRWNRLHGQSGQAYIAIDDYMARKHNRMQRAESRHGIIIIVLNYAQQQAIFADPSILEAKIAKRLSRIS